MRTMAWVLALLSGCPAFAGVDASIELLREATVGGGVITLGQVARLQSLDLPLMRTLVDLPLGHAPKPGQAVFVGPADVERRLRQRTLQDVRIAWRGSDQVRVQRPHHSVKGEAIVEAAAVALRRWLSAAGSRAEVRVAAVPRDVDVAGGDIRLEQRPVSVRPMRGRSVVWVDLWSAGSFVRSVPVSFEVPPAADSPPRRPERMGSGEESPPVRALAVQRGEWAALHTALGAVRLESRVQVLQDGREGERIRVRQLGATGVVFARVVQPGLLELAP